MTREELGRSLSPEELDKNTRDIEDAFKNVGDTDGYLTSETGETLGIREPYKLNPSSLLGVSENGDQYKFLNEKGAFSKPEETITSHADVVDKNGELDYQHISIDQKNKLTSIEPYANNYSHPLTHPITIIDSINSSSGSLDKVINERGQFTNILDYQQFETIGAGVLLPKNDNKLTTKSLVEVDENDGNLNRFLNERGVFSSLPTPAVSHSELYGKNLESEFQHITSSERNLLSNSLTGVVYLPSLPIQGGMSKLIYHNNEIYLAARNNTSKMYKYNLVDRNWIELADSPATLQTSGGTCFDGSRYIYTLRGGSTISNNFYRYDIVTNTWTTLGATQFTVSNITIGTGNGSQTVFGLWGGKSFPTSSDSSVAGVSVFVNGVSTPATINANTLTATFNTAPHSGAIITASFTLRQSMGSSGAMTIFNNEIYVVFGDDTPVFAKYNIQFNNWTILRDTPAYCDWSGMLDKVVSINGSSYIYVLRGENESSVDTPDFWRYNITSDSWEVMTSIPLATDSPDLMLCGDYILALRGVNSLHQFLYSIKNNSWIQIANSPFQTLRGSVVLYNEYSIGTSSKFDYIINDGIQGFMQINRIIVN